MNKIDYLGLDGSALKTFLCVLEEVSVSRAARRLGVSQSAVSHTLDKLRLVFDDLLFVRDGRGIIPTARAQSLFEPVKSALAALESLTHAQQFDPLVGTLEFEIAANDLPLELIFPKLLKKFHAEGIKPKFRFIPSGVPRANFKRTSHCRMLITPAPPVQKGVHKEILFESEMVCFYDARIRKPPKTKRQYFDSNYVDVKFTDTESSIMVLPSIYTAALKEPGISVPNFNVLHSFIESTNLITTQAKLMNQGPLKNLDSAPLPFKTDPLRIYLAWHQRDHDDPAHIWLREQIQGIARSICKELS